MRLTVTRKEINAKEFLFRSSSYLFLLRVSRFLVIIDWWSLLVYLQLMLWNWQQDEENDMLELYSSYSGWDWISGSVKMIFRVILFSKIQLVVYYQYCVLIGWATTRLCAYL